MFSRMSKQGSWGFVLVQGVDISGSLPKSWLFTFEAHLCAFLPSYLHIVDQKVLKQNT